MMMMMMMMMAVDKSVWMWMQLWGWYQPAVRRQTKVGWKCITTASGALSAIMLSTTSPPLLHADSSISATRENCVSCLSLKSLIAALKPQSNGQCSGNRTFRHFASSPPGRFATWTFRTVGRFATSLDVSPPDDKEVVKYYRLWDRRWNVRFIPVSPNPVSPNLNPNPITLTLTSHLD